MKKNALLLACFTLLSFALISSAHAPVEVKSTIKDNIYLVYNFKNLDETVYNQTTTNPQFFNSSTIPQIILKNLDKQNLKNVYYELPSYLFDYSTKTISVSFYLGGSDIISNTINRTSMKKIYQVKTEWRKFQVNLTSSFSINFAQLFAEPVEKWHQPSQTTYYIETHETGFFSALSFNITLPTTATNVQAQGDTITYEIPPNLEDVFFNSPFLILAVLLIITAVALIYRKIR